jgi:hypothetical protein
MSFKKSPIFDPIYGDDGSKSVIYQNEETGTQRIITTKDLSKVSELCLRSQKRNSKRTKFFNDDMTLVAKVDVNEMIAHPEWYEDKTGREFGKWLDENEDRKLIPVGFTKVMKRRQEFSAAGREKLGKILSNG